MLSEKTHVLVQGRGGTLDEEKSENYNEMEWPVK